MSKQWYIYKDQEQKGPFSWEQLTTMGNDGSLKKEDLIWTEGMDDWKKAGMVENLFLNQSSSAAQPPSPPDTGTPTPPMPKPSSGSGDSGGKKRKSPLKILAIVAGSIVGLALLGFIILLVIGLLLPAEAGELTISSVSTSSEVTPDGRPVEIEDTFTFDTETIYVSVAVEDAAAGVLLMSTWIWEDKDEILDTVGIVLPIGSSQPYFYFTPDVSWPQGSYRVEISVDEIVLATARFQIDDPGMSIYTSETFTVSYPSNWIYEIQDHTLIFSGPVDTVEYHTTVTIQKIPIQGMVAVKEELLNIFEQQLEDVEAVGGAILSQDMDTFIYDAEELAVLSYYAEYELEGSLFSQLTLIMEGLEPIFYMYSYTAPFDLYEISEDIALAMLDSFDFR